MSDVETRFLTEADVRAEVPMTRAVEAVRTAFIAFAAGEFELPLRTALGDGQFLTMNARHVPTNTAVVKAVSIDFDRRPAVQGVVSFLALGDSATVTMPAEVVTGLRTGAVSGVATDALTRPDAKRLTLIGLGAQAPNQLRAVRAVRDIEHVTLIDRRPESATAFIRDHAEALDGVEFVVSRSVNEAVAGADVICCATPSVEPLFELSALPERVHVNAVGSFRPVMRELPDALLANARVVVDQRDAAVAEAGEIRHALASGAITEDDLIELGALLTNPPPDTGVAVDKRRTVFKSVGLAVQDWAIGYAVTQS